MSVRSSITADMTWRGNRLAVAGPRQHHTTFALFTIVPAGEGSRGDTQIDAYHITSGPSRKDTVQSRGNRRLESGSGCTKPVDAWLNIPGCEQRTHPAAQDDDRKTPPGQPQGRVSGRCPRASPTTTRSGGHHITVVTSNAWRPANREERGARRRLWFCCCSVIRNLGGRETMS